MAKWGEGDPRWIVEERPDATNVNNWHWTEKNATQWSQSRLKDLLTGVKLLEDSADGVVITLVALDKCDGEANVNNRKGKLIFFYEWVLEISWLGVAKGAEENEKISGKVKIPNLSEEQNIETDLDVQYTLDDDATSASALRAKDRLYGKDQEATKKIKQLLQQYVKELKVEYSKDLIKPTTAGNSFQTTKDPDSNGTSSGSSRAKQSFSSSHVNRSSVTTPSKVKVEAEEGNVRTKNLTLSDKFRCTGEELYNALTVPDMVIAMCKDSRALCVPKPGGRFSLFDDNVLGQFTDLEPHKRIAMKWRRKNWPEGLYSDVTLDIHQSEDDGQSTLTVRQLGVPENDFEQTEEGWKRYYFHSIKTTFGFGSFLF